MVRMPAGEGWGWVSACICAGWQLAAARTAEPPRVRHDGEAEEGGDSAAGGRDYEEAFAVVAKIAQRGDGEKGEGLEEDGDADEGAGVGGGVHVEGAEGDGDAVLLRPVGAAAVGHDAGQAGAVHGAVHGRARRRPLARGGGQAV